MTRGTVKEDNKGGIYMKKWLTAAALTLMLAGCNGDSSPEEAATAFFEDVQNGNVIQAATAVKGGNLQTMFAASQLNLPITDEQRDILLESIERVYAFDNVKAIEETNTEAIVEADITTIHFMKAATASVPNMPELLLNIVLGKTTRDEAIDSVITSTIDELAQETPPTTTFTVTLTLEKDGDNYEIVPNDELLKALLGDISLVELFQ